MIDASQNNESISTELRKLSGNVFGMIQTLWRRPERQKADKIIRHQFYKALKLTNRELEKAIQSLSSPVGEPDRVQSPPQADVVNPAPQVDSAGIHAAGLKQEG